MTIQRNLLVKTCFICIYDDGKIPMTGIFSEKQSNKTKQNTTKQAKKKGINRKNSKRIKSQS